MEKKRGGNERERKLKREGKEREVERKDRWK